MTEKHQNEMKMKTIDRNQFKLWVDIWNVFVHYLRKNHASIILKFSSNIHRSILQYPVFYKKFVVDACKKNVRGCFSPVRNTREVTIVNDSLTGRFTRQSVVIWIGVGSKVNRGPLWTEGGLTTLWRCVDDVIR